MTYHKDHVEENKSAFEAAHCEDLLQAIQVCPVMKRRQRESRRCPSVCVWRDTDFTPRCKSVVSVWCDLMKMNLQPDNM